MANHKSAKKRARQTITRNAQNHSYLTSVRSAIKGFRTAAEELAASTDKDLTKISPLFVAAQSRLMKAVSKGIVKKNTASRTIGRMANFMKKSIDAKGGEVVDVVKKKVTKKKATKKKAAAKK